jgi:hypothetical protein
MRDRGTATRLLTSKDRRAKAPQTLGHRLIRNPFTFNSRNIDDADVLERLSAMVSLHGRDNSSNPLKRRGGDGQMLQCEMLVTMIEPPSSRAGN